MAKTLNRWQAATINTARRERRVLLLAGPRQCGKTTLAKQLVSEQTEYRTLDDGTLEELARLDPAGFVQHDNKMLIIDEAQRVPALIMAIKKVVDEDTRPGQFLLAGSANIRAMPSIRESLAGRITEIRLRTLSKGEICETQSGFLDRCFNQDFRENSGVRSRDDIIDMALRGGFPEAIKLERRARMRWHRDYIDAFLERDLLDITRIRRHDAMRELINTLAAWSGKLMDIARIGASLSVRRPTLESYINTLATLYLVESVRPWTKTSYNRVGKQRKIFMTDSGLMSSILGLHEDQVRQDVDRVNKLVETFAWNELASQVDLTDEDCSIYHYRDREKREIDFVIERYDGAILGIEVKVSTTAQKNDFKHLAWFRDNIANGRPFTGILLYAGMNTGSFGEGLWAVPFGELWRERGSRESPD